MKKENGTMQVIIFDKKFKCLYRLQNIPNDWNFKKVAEIMELPNDLKDYNAFRLADHDDLCIDDYVFDGKELKLTTSTCN